MNPLPWLIDHLAQEWNAVSQAPIIFISTLFLTITASYFACRWLYAEALSRQTQIADSLREQLKLQPASAGQLSTFENQVRELSAENEQLKARLSPRLEVLFGTGPPFVQTHKTSRDEEITHYGVQIQNNGASTARRVRVQIEGFHECGVPQSVSYFDPNWNRQELSLDPAEKKGIQFVETATDGRAYLIRSAGKKPLDVGRHDLTIRVFAIDLPARQVQANLEIGADGKAKLTSSK